MMRRRVFIGLAVVLMIVIGLPFLIPLDDSGTAPILLADPGGQFIDVDGLLTYMFESGSPDGTPIVFLHGLYGSTFTWRLNTPALTAYRVVTFDRPGFGLTDKPLDFDYSHANQADFTARLLDILRIDRAVIVGHSAGGNVLAHFALRHPERVERLVIVDGAIVGPGGPPSFISSLISFPPVTRWARIGLRLTTSPESLRGTVSSFYADPALLTDANFAGYWRAFQTPGWDAGLVGLSRDAAGNRLAREQIAQITAPTLIIWGEADTWTPLAQGQDLATLLPTARLVTYPGAGHQPMEERAEQFNADLMAFLAETSAAP